jgi:hypothetical protein
MKTVLQIEFSPSLLSEREAFLKQHGSPVISILGSSSARNVDVSASGIGVIVVGHGAPWLERESLIAYFRELLPGASARGAIVSTALRKQASGRFDARVT